VQTRGSRRGLSTARAALQVAWLLAARPEGVRADHIAETLGKSVSTAYNLLASLCDEGVAERHPGGLYRLSQAFRDTVAWYQKNESWWRPIKEGEFRAYYERTYGQRKVLKAVQA